MNLLEFKYPDYKRFMVSSSEELLDEAVKRGFDNWNNPYCKLFSNLFFKGGKVKPKNGDEKLLDTDAWKYCRALMGSYEPKHEHKMAICALIMSEVLEPESEVVK